MEYFIKLITSQEAGNIGDLLSGLGIAVAAAAYLHQKNQKNVRDFQKKVTQTFFYGRKFQEYYEKFFFLHFYEYLQSILVNRIPLKDFKIRKDHIEYSGDGAEEIVREEATDFFLLLQELMYVLKKNKEHNFIDEDELGKIIKSYASQIKDFFSVVDVFIAKSRKQDPQGWGYIREDNFVSLKTFFQSKYDFLK